MPNPSSTISEKGCGYRVSARVLLATAAVAALVGSSYAPAFAEDSAPQTVTANVEVGSSISLALADSSFTLTGDPGTTATDTVDYTVTTNNPGGYVVNVVPVEPALRGTAGNTDTIAWSDLLESDSAAGATPGNLLDDGPTDIRTKATRSAASGDTSTSTYTLEIPFVNPGTYTGTLNYIVSTL